MVAVIVSNSSVDRRKALTARQVVRARPTEVSGGFLEAPLAIVLRRVGAGSPGAGPGRLPSACSTGGD